MTVPLCFIDTETTGVHPGRRAWEVAIIRREPDGTEDEWLAQVEDVDLSAADPFGLKVGGFYERHHHYRLTGKADGEVWPESEIAMKVEYLTRGAHLVGAVPSFDAEVFADMLRRHRLAPAWHYHLIDVEALAVGWLNGQSAYLRAQAKRDGNQVIGGAPVVPPWKSDDLSRAVGVEPATEEDRHTALGDARWAMRLYDAITGPAA